MGISSIARTIARWFGGPRSTSYFAVTALCAGALALALFRAGLSPAPRLATAEAATEPHKTRVQLGSHFYDIPAGYAELVPRDQAQPNVVQVEFFLLLPDLAPRTPANASKFLVRGHGDKLLGS